MKQISEVYILNSKINVLILNRRHNSTTQEFYMYCFREICSLTSFWIMTVSENPIGGWNVTCLNGFQSIRYAIFFFCKRGLPSPNISANHMARILSTSYVHVHTRTVNVCAMLMISYVILKYAPYDWLKCNPRLQKKNRIRYVNCHVDILYSYGDSFAVQYYYGIKGGPNTWQMSNQLPLIISNRMTLYYYFYSKVILFLFY